MLPSEATRSCPGYLKNALAVIYLPYPARFNHPSSLSTCRFFRVVNYLLAEYERQDQKIDNRCQKNF